MKSLISLLLLLGLATPVLGYEAIGSPTCTLRILNEDGKAVVGLKIKREWDGSDGKKGEEEAVTDIDGKVRFKKVIIQRSVARRIFKPLLMLVPASCGPSWETTSFTSLEVHWPGAYDLRLSPTIYKHKRDQFFDYYYSQDGTHIDGPEKGDKPFRVYFFDRRKDFDLTLRIYKRSAEQ